MLSDRGSELSLLCRTIISCRRCPRLVRWREAVARTKVRRYHDQQYWGKPVPGFGDPRARLLVVGLAPAAHGGNRTGRMFTGDNSGLWLYRALYTAGFASKPESLHRNDGMSLIDCYITAAVRCVPPKNKPTPKEIANCRSYLLREIRILSNIRVVIGLGKVGFDAVADALREVGHIQFTSRPRFVHGKSYHYAGVTLIASYHPSQQNTFTGKLTEALFDRVFRNARELLR